MKEEENTRRVNKKLMLFLASPIEDVIFMLFFQYD